MVLDSIRMGLPLFKFCTSKNNKSFYRRSLPSFLIGFSTYQGKKIFAEALKNGGCQSYFKLSQHFITQSQVSTCGSASLAMILNALGVDPGVNWKGIWRWYDDYNIQGMPKSKISEGLTLKQFEKYANINLTKSLAFSPKGYNEAAIPISLQFFRNSVQACTKNNNLFMTLNFSRKALNQTGDGHFGPVAAYNKQKDLALIMDVAKFKYDCYWCPITKIYQSLKPIDKQTGFSRGFILSKKVYFNQTQPSALCSLDIDSRLNKKLKDCITKQNKQQSFIKILNNNQFYSLLIPILFQYTTAQFYHDKKITKNNQMIIKQLNNQSKTFLQSFGSKIQQIIEFLYAIMVENNYNNEINDKKLNKLIRRSKLYLQLNKQNKLLSCY